MIANVHQKVIIYFDLSQRIEFFEKKMALRYTVFYKSDNYRLFFFAIIIIFCNNRFKNPFESLRSSISRTVSMILMFFYNWRNLGSSLTLSQSPMTLQLITTSKMAKPGQVLSHQALEM